MAGEIVRCVRWRGGQENTWRARLIIAAVGDARSVDALDALVATQDQFHNSTSPLRPELAVRMSRREAKTVSRSVIEVDFAASEGRMRHFEDPEDRTGQDQPAVSRFVLQSPVDGVVSPSV